MADAFPDRSAIASSQLAQLRSLLGAIIPSNRFQAGKFSDPGLDKNVASLEEFCHRIPFTTKEEIVRDQLASPPYGTNLTFARESYTRFHQTSGTTGTPVRWLDTPESWEWMVGNWRKIFEAADVGRHDRILFAFSFGPFIGFWLAFDAGQRIGALCLPGGGLSSVARLRIIFDNSVTVVCCTPTYAMRLGEVGLAEKFPLETSPVRKIIVAGEPGGSVPATRARLQKFWPGARILDHHGMTEVGPVTFECPARHGVLHIIESAYLPEIVDAKSGRPVKPGQVGELVLTTLGRVGSPLLRYRTGDLVKQASGGPVCSCGRFDLALENGILGRVDDMLVVRGVNVFPSAVEDVLRGFPEVLEYQVRVGKNKTLPELSVKIEVSGAADEVSERVQTALQAAFSLRIPIEVMARLPRFEMKAQRWIYES